jgi:GxxExxY protein
MAGPILCSKVLWNIFLSRMRPSIIGVCMEVHNILGHGFLEIVYKDAIEYELRERQFNYCREREYVVQYKEIILPHKFFADFVLFDSIVLEVKAAEGGISNEFVSRMLNYLKVPKCKVGLIVNFGTNSLQHRRLIL